jgi:HSP20 family protein
MADKELAKTELHAVAACCDVFEEDGKIVLKMEMPGVAKDDLNINVNGDELIIEGARKSVEFSEGQYLIREIRDADFYRSYTIDESVDREKIQAELSNGILTLTLGIKESEKPKKIKVIAG